MTVESDLLSLANDAAEMALIACAMQDGELCARLTQQVPAEAFSSALHVGIWRAMRRQALGQSWIDWITLRSEVARLPELAEVGAEYLLELQESAVSVPAAESYAERVVDLYRRREAYRAGIALAAAVLTDPVADRMETVDEVLQAHEAALGRITAGQSARRVEAVRIGQTAAAVVEATEAAFKSDSLPPGVIQWGIEALDEATSGMWPGQLVIVAGRPSMGKSALALNGAAAAAASGQRVLFYSAEMTAAECAQRIIAGLTGIPIGAQRSGRVIVGDFVDLAGASALMRQWPLDLIECSGSGMSSIASHARRQHRAAPCGLVVIDHLHRLRLDRKFGISDVAALGDAAREAKNLALALEIPVLLVAQLNRSVDTGGEVRLPQLSDLRASGEIEQEADCVALVHRDEYYLETGGIRERPDWSNDKRLEAQIKHQEALERSRGRATLVIAKARQGKRDTVETTWDAQRQCFGGAWRGWR